MFSLSRGVFSGSMLIFPGGTYSIDLEHRPVRASLLPTKVNVCIFMYKVSSWEFDHPVKYRFLIFDGSHPVWEVDIRGQVAQLPWSLVEQTFLRTFSVTTRAKQKKHLGHMTFAVSLLQHKFTNCVVMFVFNLPTSLLAMWRFCMYRVDDSKRNSASVDMENLLNFAESVSIAGARQDVPVNKKPYTAF